MATLAAIFVPILLSIVTHEIVAHAPSISRWLVTKASLQLREEDRKRYLPEWLAVIDDLPGVVRKLRFALSLYLHGASQTNRELHKYHPLQNPVVRNAALAFNLIGLNVRMYRTIVPFVFTQLLKGRLRNIRFLYSTQKVMILTSLLSVMKKHSPQQHEAALQETFDKIRNIVGKK